MIHYADMEEPTLLKRIMLFFHCLVHLHRSYELVDEKRKPSCIGCYTCLWGDEIK